MLATHCLPVALQPLVGPRLPYHPSDVQERHTVANGCAARVSPLPDSAPPGPAAARLQRRPIRELAALPVVEMFAAIERQHDGDLRAQRWLLKSVVIELKHRLAQVQEGA